MENYQRKGSNSNKEVGDIFEEKVFKYFSEVNEQQFRENVEYMAKILSIMDGNMQ